MSQSTLIKAEWIEFEEDKHFFPGFKEFATNWLEEANEYSIINEEGDEQFVDENTFNYIVIKDFVAQQEFFCINLNGKIERNNIVKEFEKYCYENKTTTKLSREYIIKLVKDEYYVLSNTDLTRDEFFESLKPNKFKYRW